MLEKTSKVFRKITIGLCIASFFYLLYIIFVPPAHSYSAGLLGPMAGRLMLMIFMVFMTMASGVVMVLIDNKIQRIKDGTDKLTSKWRNILYYAILLSFCYLYVSFLVN